ncbi:MAG: pyrroline-5-carboxylate reductase [Candidatus Omnitrophota bacterium]|nr:pyrroline-5-carboxylate reductase [Candidatus Omnitrophota bacterium]
MIGKKIGVIGCGNMGRALVKGLLARNLVAKQDVLIADQVNEQRDHLKSESGVLGSQSNKALVAESQIVILAVKPRDIKRVLEELAGLFKPNQIVISIAAGITISYLARFVTSKVGLARVMPNSPALINQAVSAVCYSPALKDADKEMVRAIFGSLGEVVEIEESLMDTVTAISGSGPAYFFLLIKYLAEIGVEFGLTRQIADRLALQTALGSSRMAVEAGGDVDGLINKVASKGGTTQAALKVFKEMKLKQIYLRAVQAARTKARELSGG